MAAHTGFSPPIDECDSMKRARATAQRFVRASIPILLRGETGTGRATLAQAIAAARSGGRPVLTILGLDSFRGPIPESDDLVVLGADDLSADDQRRLAGMVSRRASVVVTGSSANGLDPGLATLLDAGTLVLPPLRDREGDVAKWCRFFVATAAQKIRLGGISLRPDADDLIRLHAWPGNLHEVKQRAERAVAMADSNEITPRDLGLDGGSVVPAVKPLEEAVNEFRRNYIRAVLERCGGNRSHAARVLQVDARTIFRFLQAEPKK